MTDVPEGQQGSARALPHRHVQLPPNNNKVLKSCLLSGLHICDVQYITINYN